MNKIATINQAEFPDMGLSPRNLWNMKRFYERYHLADEKLLRSVAVLPWYQNAPTRRIADIVDKRI